MSREPMTTGQDIAHRRALPFKLGLAENDRLAFHIVYGLYALSLVTAFPSLLGAVLAFLKREDIRGTWLESHATWQIRTFCIMLIASIISAALAATIILIPFAGLLTGVTWLWFGYRTIKGWLKLSDNAPIDAPERFF
jgi:uncharacterized membrane protein